MAIFTWQTWLAVTLICGLVELFYFNTYTLCLSVAAFITMVASIFGVMGAWQLILFAVLAGSILLIDEKFLKASLLSMKGDKNGDKETPADKQD